MSWPFIVFLLCWLVGLVGTFIPVFPATLIIFVGSVIATLMDGFQPWLDLPFLISFAALTVFISLIDNFASAWGARRYGGSRQAGWGALVGGLLGIFIPFGLIVGPLSGALLAELLIVKKPFVGALWAAWGTLIGLLTGIAAKLVLHLLIGLFELWRLWKPKASIFS